MHGVPVAIDKRSLMYLDGVTVDFHDEINRRGFSNLQPQRQDDLRLRQLVLDVMLPVYVSRSQILRFACKGMPRRET